MKSRVNSRINNVRKGKNNSLLTKKQGYFSVPRNEALGYCLMHQIYIGEKIYINKNCNKCRRFVVLQSI